MHARSYVVFRGINDCQGQCTPADSRAILRIRGNRTATICSEEPGPNAHPPGLRAAAPIIRASLPAEDEPTEGRLGMFVDDGKLYASSKSLDTNVRHLRALFNVARRWAADEGLLLDDAKRDLAHFTGKLLKLGGRSLKQLPRPSLTLPNNDGSTTTLRPATTYRWLGIIWDPQMTFAAHVKTMAARASRVVDALQMLGTNKHGLPPIYLRSIHIACTLSILCFAAAVWYLGDETRQLTLVDKLSKPLNRAMQQITGAFKTTPIEALHIESSIPPIDLLLMRRRQAAALRLARMPTTHPILQRLGAAWHRGTAVASPPPLPPPKLTASGNGKQTRLQMLAREYDPDGERIDQLHRAPWDDPVGDQRWRGRLTVKPKPPALDKRHAALEHLRTSRQLRKDEHNVLVYSDGSLLDAHCGAGFAIFHGRRQVTSRALGLGQAADVYDGEMHGLEMSASPALAYASSLPFRHVHVYFFADNNSAVSQICEQRPAPCQAFSIGFMRRVEEFLLEDDSHRVTVAWIPGHEDIAGQEASDTLAKAGTKRASSLRFSSTITHARRSFTTNVANRWAERWAGAARNNAYEPANRIAPSLRPTQQLRKYDKKTLAALVQCRTGHAHTGEYYRSIRKPERGFACPCGEALQTRDHILIECPQYERHRRVLRDVSPSLQVSELLGTKAGINATATFLRRSGAFGRPTTEVEDAAGH